MSIFDRKPALRWVTPLAFVAVVAGTTGIVATATADSPLPAISAQDLLTKVQHAQVDALSGTVVQDSNLGLPSLPGLGGSDNASLTSLMSGTHTLRVWKSGSDKARLQVLGTNGESDIVVNGKNVWSWSYKDNTATHRTLTAPTQGERSGTQAQKMPTDLPKTPEDAAKQALAEVGKTTDISVGANASVAGRKAYELILTPKAGQNSLIDAVRIDVDGQNGLPLQVEVLAGKDNTSVFKVGYSVISFAQPNAEQFNFNPPPNAKVKNIAPNTQKPAAKAPTKKQLQAHKAEQAAHAKDTTVVGKGWGSVVITKLDAKTTDQASGQLAQVLKSLPATPANSGVAGKLFSSTALSAVLTDDGRLAVGAVAPQQLYDALAK